jgi:hypothetical protein
MELIYRGVRYRPLTELSEEEAKQVVGYAIFELKYRGNPYLVCRYRIQKGFVIERRLLPADPSLSRLSLKLSTLRKKPKPLVQEESGESKGDGGSCNG